MAEKQGASWSYAAQVNWAAYGRTERQAPLVLPTPDEIDNPAPTPERTRMRPLLILFTLVMLATGCGSEPAPKRPADSTPDETHEPTLEETYEALDSFAETFITAANPDFEFQRGKEGEIYGCGGFEGVDWTRHRYTYVVATTTDDPERALTRAQEILAEIDVTASSIR